MKKYWIGLLFLPLLVISCNQEYLQGITGHGEIVTRVLVMDDFAGFKNTIAADVFISQGEEQEVIIEAQDNIIDNLELDRVENGFFTIKYDSWVRRAKPVKIYMTVPNLDKVVISGPGNVRGETPFTDLDELNLVISRSGNIFLDFESECLELTISGTGDLNLSGEAQTIEAIISGTGNIRAFDLVSERVDCHISGTGDAWLSAEDYLLAVITGGGNIIYKGTPETMYVHVSGSGKVLAR